MQSSGGQPESNSIMHQHFHAVGASIGKEVSGVRVGTTEDLDNACQGRVDASAHVQGFCGEPHGINVNHASTSRSHCAHWLDALMGQWICTVVAPFWSSMRMSACGTAVSGGTDSNLTGMKAGLV